MDTPQSPTQDPVLDEFYIALSTLEQREVDVANLGRTQQRQAILKAMLPIKRAINNHEGSVIYPEAEFDYHTTGGNMEINHTPAPWKHIPRNRDGHADIISHNGRHFIQVGVPYAEHPILDYPHENQQTANARLIAASPDLLVALNNLTDWARTHTSPRDANSPHDLLIAAQAAITKATKPTA